MTLSKSRLFIIFNFLFLTLTYSQKGNHLLNISNQTLGDFKWLNEPEEFSIEKGVLRITASKETDFFNNPENVEITNSAPVFYTEKNSDFVATALVKPDFSSQWNAVALMVLIDEKNWIKFAFENSDATGKSIVTVVTKGVSDDANGAVLEKLDQVWLRLIRKGNIYSMLWSEDATNWKMARLATLPEANTVKIGVEAQCPLEGPTEHEILFFSVENRTVNDLRKGL